eukprot:1138816-Ditylum_brightwellii.AAC.1
MYLRDGDISSVTELLCLVNGDKAIDEVEAAVQEEEEDEQGNGSNNTVMRFGTGQQLDQNAGTKNNLQHSNIANEHIIELEDPLK